MSLGVLKTKQTFLGQGFEQSKKVKRPKVCNTSVLCYYAKHISFVLLLEIHPSVMVEAKMGSTQGFFCNLKCFT